MPTAYEIRFPSYFDAEAGIIQAKGWFADLEVVAGDQTYRPVFYDPTRLQQTIDDELAADGLFTEPSLVVVPAVTRQAIENAVEMLSRTDFEPLRRSA